MVLIISYFKINLKIGYMNCYKNNLNSFGMLLMGIIESSNLFDIKKKYLLFFFLGVKKGLIKKVII